MADSIGLLSTYPDAWKIFLSIFLISNILTGLLYWLAKSKKIMPAIRARDVHTTRKPRVGGVAMWLTALLALFYLNGARPGLLVYGLPADIGTNNLTTGIMLGMIVLLVFGLLDDLFSLNAAWQFLGQFLAGTMLIVAGCKVPYINLPFDYKILLNQTVWHIGSFSFLPWSSLFIYFWIITMINVMNFFDGLDGLVASVAMTASVVLLFVSLRLGFSGPATLCLIVLGCAAGFLPWNWNPSKLFMGTVGSQLLGFFLGVIAIISGAKVATAVLVLGIPVFDAFIVIIRRLLAHEHPWQADQRHLHHRLLKIGLNTKQVVLVTNGIALLFGIFALQAQQANQKGILTILLLLCIIGFVIFTYLLERRAVQKVD